MTETQGGTRHWRHGDFKNMHSYRRKEQKRQLMQLKMLEKKYTTLNKLIAMTEAEMDEEDVAWVEKKVSQISEEA